MTGLNSQARDAPVDAIQNVIATETALVTSAKTHTSGDDVGHVVRVKPTTMDSAIKAEVLADSLGSTTIPEEGNRVVIAYHPTGRPTVVGVRYSAADTVPEYEPGERRVGHPASDAHIRLTSDGKLKVIGDTDVVVNGGTRQAIVDVSAADTNSNGGITSLDITRSPNVYLPE